MIDIRTARHPGMRARGRWRLAAVVLAGAAVLGACGGGDSTPPPSALSYRLAQPPAVGVALLPADPAVQGRVVRYSVTPALPAGLRLDEASGRISGTPEVATPEATYTVTAHNDAGTTTYALTLKVVGVEVRNGGFTRSAAAGTSVTAQVQLRPLHFGFTPGLTVLVQEGTAFQREVATTDNGDGSVTLTLATHPGAPPGTNSGTLTLSLCRDAACAARQEAPSASLSYTLRVVAADAPWPGDNLTALAPLDGVGDWSTFQGNAAHTGYVPIGLDPARIGPRWTVPAVQVRSGFNGPVSNVATADGRLFVTGGAMLYARREHDGSEAWRYDFSGLEFPSVNPAAVAGGVVYVAAGQQSSAYLHAFDAASGQLRFKSRMSAQWENYLAPTVGAQGVYTNAGSYGGLYAFAPGGDALFFAPLDQTSVWTPAVDAGGVYTYTGGMLRVLDPVTGAETVAIRDDTFENYIYEIVGAPVLGAPGSVFVANYGNAPLNGGLIGNTLMNLRVDTRSVAWRVRGVYPTTPAYHDGVLYAVNNNPLRLEARSEADGALHWSWAPPLSAEQRFVSEVLLTRDLVFVSTNAATYAIDRRTRLPVWSHPLPGKLALSRQGVLYIQGETSLVAFNLR